MAVRHLDAYANVMTEHRALIDHVTGIDDLHRMPQLVRKHYDLLILRHGATQVHH